MVIYMKTNKHLWSHAAQFFLECETFQTNVEKTETHITCSIIFPPRKSCLLWDNVENYSRAGQATDDNMAHALYVLDT